MRMLIAFLWIMLACASAWSQERAPKSKTPVARTYLQTIDTSSGRAAVDEFVAAYAVSDYVRAYLLLSPEAKDSFMTRVHEYNLAQLFPSVSDGKSLGVFNVDYGGGPDVLKETFLDGVLMFDHLMLEAEQLGELPFRLERTAVASPTLEDEAEARYLVPAAGDPGVVVITTTRLSNGAWRVDRIVWATSDTQARPWGLR